MAAPQFGQLKAAIFSIVCPSDKSDLIIRVSGISTAVCVFEKIVSRPENIFSMPKTMVGTTPTMVEIDRCWKLR